MHEILSRPVCVRIDPCLCFTFFDLCVWLFLLKMTFCWLTSNVLSTLPYLLIVAYAYAVSISRAPCDYLGSPP